MVVKVIAAIPNVNANDEKERQRTAGVHILFDRRLGWFGVQESVYDLHGFDHEFNRRRGTIGRRLLVKRRE